MNPIMMTLAAENARRLAQMGLANPVSFSLPTIDFGAILAILTSWTAAPVVRPRAA